MQAIVVPRVSLSTFRQLVPRYFMQPRKESDLCHVCETGKLVEKRLERAWSRNIPDVQYQDIYWEMEAYKTHRRHAQQQRDLYNDHKDHPPKGALVVIVDFKEKIRLGPSARETGQSYYDHSLRLILGITCRYLAPNGETVETQYINFISEILNSDGLFV